MKLFITDNNDHPNNDTIFTPLLGNVRRNDFVFHLEKEKWDLTFKLNEAHVVPIVLAPFTEQRNYGIVDHVTVEHQINFTKHLSDNQYLVILLHTHVSDYTNHKDWKKTIIEKYNFYKNVLIVDINTLDDDDINIYYNFCFNFVKAYFTEYSRFDLRNRMFTGAAGPASFVLPKIKDFTLQKRFMIPNVIRQGTGEYKEYVRTRIKNEIIQYDCFFSDLPNGIQLYPQEPHLANAVTPNGAGILPMANTYYNSSAVSVYCETIATGKNNVNAITEKTYIPLIKGHFILPFGYSGLIRDLVKQGFKFPDWIDYSYDIIYDDEERLEQFFTSIRKLREIPIQEFTDLANRDFEIRTHNRNVFYQTPYDSLFDKIKRRIN